MEQALINFFDYRYDFNSQLNKRAKIVVLNSVKEILRQLGIRTKFYQRNLHYSVFENELSVNFHFDPSLDCAVSVFTKLVNIIRQSDPYSNILSVRKEPNEQLKYRYEFWINSNTNDSFDTSEFDRNSELATQFELDDEWYHENRRLITVTASINDLQSNFLSFSFDLADVTNKIDHILEKERFILPIDNEALLWVMDKMETHDTRPLRSFYFIGKLKENMKTDIVNWLEENIGGETRTSKNWISNIFDFGFFTLTVTTNTLTLRTEFNLEELESRFDWEIFEEDEEDEDEENHFDSSNSHNKYNGFENRSAFNDFYGIDDDENYQDEDYD